MSKRKQVCFIFFIVLFSSYAQAKQDTSSSSDSSGFQFSALKNVLEYAFPKKDVYWMEFLEEVGPIINSTGDAGKVVIDQSHYRAHSIKFAWQRPPNKIYSTIYRLPKLGFGLYFGNFKNENIGYPKALFAWFEMPFKYPYVGQKWSFGYSGGFGLAWDFKTFNDDIENSNIFISTTRNCYFDISAYVSYHFNERFQVSLSLGFKHFSNGARSKPNYGLNMFPIGLSAKYQISDHSQKDWWHRAELPQYLRHWRINIKGSLGQKQNSIGNPVYWKSVIGFNILRQISYKYRLGFGLEANISLGKKDDDIGGGYRDDAKEIINPGIVGSWEWVIIPRIVVPIDIGVYLLPKKGMNDEGSRIYERIGVKGYITDHFWVGLTIKAHTQVADFFEWGIGYTFHNDKNVMKIDLAL